MVKKIPNIKLTTQIRINCDFFKVKAAKLKLIKPKKLPHVPGMGLRRPLPKPNDSKCAGCDSIKGRFGERFCGFIISKRKKNRVYYIDG